MERTNYNIARAEVLIGEALKNLPVGLAYYILKGKTAELETLYWNQVEIETAEVMKEAETQAKESEDPDEEKE